MQEEYENDWTDLRELKSRIDRDSSDFEAYEWEVGIKENVGSSHEYLS